MTSFQQQNPMKARHKGSKTLFELAEEEVVASRRNSCFSAKYASKASLAMSSLVHQCSSLMSKKKELSLHEMAEILTRDDKLWKEFKVMLQKKHITTNFASREYLVEFVSEKVKEEEVKSGHIAEAFRRRSEGSPPLRGSFSSEADRSRATEYFQKVRDKSRDKSHMNNLVEKVALKKGKKTDADNDDSEVYLSVAAAAFSLKSSLSTSLNSSKEIFQKAGPICDAVTRGSISLITASKAIVDECSSLEDELVPNAKPQKRRYVKGAPVA